MSRRRGRRPSNPPPDLLGAIYPSLDLHGLTAHEAVSTARAWIASRRDDGDLLVRIITGRGLHSPGPPVLPGAIEHLLTSMKASAVRAFEAEPGGGAYRVRLKPRPADPKAPITQPPRPPHLVRRAEEALAELGITPTPTLIEAEIRRIIKEEPDKVE